MTLCPLCLRNAVLMFLGRDPNPCRKRIFMAISKIQGFGLDVAKTIAYKPDHVWDGTTYHGASLAALQKLGRAKGYTLVHTESWAPNAFFVKKRELPVDYIERPIHELTDWGAYREPRDTADRNWVSV